MLAMDPKVDAREFHSLPDQRGGIRWVPTADPNAGLFVVRTTYCVLRVTGRPVSRAAARQMARERRASEGPNCKVDVLPAVGNWVEPQRMKP